MKVLKKAKQLLAGLRHIYIKPSGAARAEELRLLQRYYSLSEPLKTPLKTGVVMKVDGRTMHGGLSDRLRGICSVYHWCKLHHVPFYIHFTYPFRLQDYLAPAQTDWLLADDELSHNPTQAEPVMLMLHLVPSKLHKLFLNHIEQKARKKQLHVYSNTVMFDSHYSQTSHELFRPVPALEAAVRQQKELIGKPFTAMVLRFQQLLGDFKEGDYAVLPAEEREALIEQCLAKIDELHRTHHADRPVLITSDSTTFLEAATKRLPYVRIISGKVVHMDYTLDASFEVYLKSFVDMYTLAEAEKIYLLRTGQMYRSGFAPRAAAINNTPYEYVNF